MHESDPGMGHLVPSLILFDISHCFGSCQSKSDAEWMKTILQPSCREKFEIIPMGKNEKTKNKVVEVQHLLDSTKTKKKFISNSYCNGEVSRIT